MAAIRKHQVVIVVRRDRFQARTTQLPRLRWPGPGPITKMQTGAKASSLARNHARLPPAVAISALPEELKSTRYGQGGGGLQGCASQDRLRAATPQIKLMKKKGGPAIVTGRDAGRSAAQKPDHARSSTGRDERSLSLSTFCWAIRQILLVGRSESYRPRPATIDANRFETL